MQEKTGPIKEWITPMETSYRILQISSFVSILIYMYMCVL